MRIRMLQIAVLVGVAVATLAVQAKTLPEFMNAQQLTDWRAQHAAPAVAATQAPDAQTSFFTGKPYDAASGTYLFKYRAYSPNLARWTSADPSGFPDGANNFSYVRNEILCSLDPDGQSQRVANYDSHKLTIPNSLSYAQIMAAGVAGGIVGGGTGAALGAIFPKLATAICAAAVAAIGAVGGSVADIAFAWDSFKNAENKDYAVGKIGFDGLIVYTDYKDIPDNWTAGAPPTDGGHYMGNLFDCSFGATSLLFTANIYSIVKYNYNE